MVVALNMGDEAELLGFQVDTPLLEEELGVDVVKTVAVERLGIIKVARKLADPRLPKMRVELPEAVERALGLLEEMLSPLPVSPRGIALQLLTGDPTARRVIEQRLGSETLAEAEAVAENLQREFPRLLEVVITDLHYAEAERLAERAVSRQPGKRNLLDRFGRLAQQPLPGSAIAILVIALMYMFVGMLGATTVVDWLAAHVFDGWLTPLSNRLAQHVPWVIVRDAIVDTDFGLLPSGLFLAFGLVLPVLLFFYFAFAILQDSGYLARLSVLLDRLLRMVGLNGKGVLPLAMGFSCVTMALITTRMLESKRERTIASLLLMLGVPCAPLLSVMLVVLGDMPLSASLVVFGMIGTQMLVAGALANKLLPGRGADFLMEIPPMRIPRMRRVLHLTLRQTYHFMKEAVPYFMAASLALFVFDRLGGLVALERAAEPLIGAFLGLPDASLPVFIKTFIRREAGAAELADAGPLFDNVQLVVTMLVMTFLTPCVNAILVLFKERGAKVALSLLGLVFTYALAVGGFVNHACRWLGVTF